MKKRSGSIIGTGPFYGERTCRTSAGRAGRLFDGEDNGATVIVVFDLSFNTVHCHKDTVMMPVTLGECGTDTLPGGGVLILNAAEEERWDAGRRKGWEGWKVGRW